MSENDILMDKELFLEKFEKMSLKIEQLSSEISKMKEKLDKTNKYNRSFGLEAIRNSKPLSFAKEIHGIKSPTKRYIMSIRTVSELWKGRKSDFLIAIRQQEKETQLDIKAQRIEGFRNHRNIKRNNISNQQKWTIYGSRSQGKFASSMRLRINY